MEEELRIETFKWKTQTRYRCPECPFDGPTVEHVVDHWIHKHKEKRTPKPQLFDADDKEIGYSEGKEIHVKSELQDFRPSVTHGESSDEEFSF